MSYKKERGLFEVGDRLVRMTRQFDHTDVYLYHASKEYWYSHMTLPADAKITQEEAEGCVELIEKLVGEYDHETVHGVRIREDK